MTQEQEFFRAAGNFLQCRLAELDDTHKDQVGAFIGAHDWSTEMRFIVEDWRKYGNDSSNRSKEAKA